MCNALKQRIRSTQGETLVETLVATLIVVAVSLFFAAAVSSAFNINHQAKLREDELSRQITIAENQSTKLADYVTDGTVTVGATTYNVTYYGKNYVASYNEKTPLGRACDDLNDWMKENAATNGNKTWSQVLSAWHAAGNPGIYTLSVPEITALRMNYNLAVGNNYATLTAIPSCLYIGGNPVPATFLCTTGEAGSWPRPVMIIDNKYQVVYGVVSTGTNTLVGSGYIAGKGPLWDGQLNPLSQGTHATYSTFDDFLTMTDAAGRNYFVPTGGTF